MFIFSPFLKGQFLFRLCISIKMVSCLFSKQDIIHAFQEFISLSLNPLFSGTTWMQELITLVLSKGDPTIVQSQPNWARAPWLEQYYCADVLKASTGPRIITTHLPYHLLAPALQHSKAKVSRWANHKLSFITFLLNFLASDKCLPFLRLYM